MTYPKVNIKPESVAVPSNFDQSKTLGSFPHDYRYLVAALTAVGFVLYLKCFYLSQCDMHTSPRNRSIHIPSLSEYCWLTELRQITPVFWFKLSCSTIVKSSPLSHLRWKEYENLICLMGYTNKGYMVNGFENAKYKRIFVQTVIYFLTFMWRKLRGWRMMCNSSSVNFNFIVKRGYYRVWKEYCPKHLLLGHNIISKKGS